MAKSNIPATPGPAKSNTPAGAGRMTPGKGNLQGGAAMRPGLHTSHPSGKKV